MLDLGIDLDFWPWIWMSIAVIFALIELTILGGSFILLPFAISAFAAALLGFYDVSIEVQWSVFAFGGAALFIGFYRWAERFMSDNTLPPGVGADRLVGLVGIVTADITADDTDRRGRVSIDGEVWGALTDTEGTIPKGSKVRVRSMQGTRVLVEPLPPPDSDPTADPTEGDHP